MKVALLNLKLLFITVLSVLLTVRQLLGEEE